MFVISVEPGEEVLATVAQQARERGVVNGAIVSLIGAVDAACIGNMPKNDPQGDVLTEYREPMELSGTGEITDGKSHIHCVLSAQDNSTFAGHLHWATVGNWFVRAYVVAM
ncbi:MAG: DUF296 domain-containing protein [Acidimicrobiales bacterium]|nr:MAG: DUF296 domain-containing protein [Acidimicrobiales bacterium]